MVQKNIKIGRKEFDYNLPNNPDINRFIIKVHNETANQRSYYFFTKTEEWILMANDEDCVFMTIYGTRDNGEVLSKDFYNKPTSGEIQKQSSRPYQSMCSMSLNTINCEVKERVPLPNVSHPVFILKGSQEGGTNFYVQILKHENTEFIQLSTSVNNEIKDSTIELQSRRNYTCKLYKVDKRDEQYVVTADNSYLSLKTRNCQRDVEKLKEKAKSYIQGHSVYSVNYLYRNKPSCHPTILQSKKTGIIAKYLKDNNGDQYSSINNNICGLHFSATPANSSGDLPMSSYFGDYRIMIFPEYLVDGCHLYFADFFCMSRIHWVTLVLTKAGSKEDDFCQNRLVKLDIENNPFFYKVGASYKVTSLDVEILYTEDINLNEMRLKMGFQEKTTPTCGKGRSTPGGRPKNTSCSSCNLPHY
ncbi:hypothetical protein LOTGIDRAFT_168898 [Lottia gigantea]|uniref:Phytanoyl-CoA hydroxylase-interacting protein-like C-terminal domain-containing protein n=1 Tax=Lottia gigantea TaxID=225164 RepID=V3Z086_LOTGI|nr:hypothetical protein LOTGIDRAFT_168898 [Lottia gigantea]ESO83853.1 hypothetical protein LOTGIDRAFT_168898 [Lottia gigantea]